jgi:hypothetical protein
VVIRTHVIFVAFREAAQLVHDRLAHLPVALLVKQQLVGQGTELEDDGDRVQAGRQPAGWVVARGTDQELVGGQSAAAKRQH